IAQECTWRHPRHTIDQDTVYHCVQRGIKNSRCDPGSVRSMVLNGLRVEIRLVVLVIENLGDNNFRRDILAVLVLVMRIAVCCIALGKASRITETGRIKERMRVVDASVDVPNLDPGAGHGSATSSGPRWVGIDDEMALAQIRMVKSIVLSALYHRRGCNCRQRGTVQFYSHRIKRNVVLAGNPCSWRICSQPSLEVVPSSVQLGSIRSHGIAIEIDFSAVWRLGTRIGTYRSTFELDNRTGIVDVLAAGKGVSVGIRSRRTAYAKCDNTQANRGEYEECCDDFFHRF